MRFLLGLCLGAFLVFMAVAGLKQSNKLATTVEDLAAKPASWLEASSNARDEAVQPKDPIQPTREPQRAPPVTEIAVPILEDAFEMGVQPEPAQTREPVKALESRGTEPINTLPEPAELTHKSIADGQISQPTHLASVWAPFHSQASATGFARRLRAELDKDFTVHKAGPANYHVVFAYDNELERSNIYRQISKVTGQVKGKPQP